MKRLLIALITLFGIFSLVACGINVQEIDYKEVETVGRFQNYTQLKHYLDTFYKDNQYITRNVPSLGIMDGDVWMSAEADSTQSSELKSHSESNDQVDGVNEADTILTDGTYIYVVSQNRFFMIEAASLSITDTFVFESGYLANMYLAGDKVVLIGTETVYSDSDDIFGGISSPSRDFIFMPYYYSYGTRVFVLDVSDAQNIQIDKTLYFESASLTQSRMIDGNVFLIMNNYASYYGYRDGLYIPRYIDSTVSENLTTLPARNIYYMPSDYVSAQYLILASFAVEGDKKAQVDAYLGSAYQIYMSKENLYCTVYRYVYDDVAMRYLETTIINRFANENGVLVYQASASVSGTPLNQFSMDEHEGHFRIATTCHHYLEDQWVIDNQITIFDASEPGVFEQVSELTGLGKPGERIYAVRFNGDVGYVVTFVQTDPLYKVDLSDPLDPEILGEWYEDGVSDYLHLFGDDLQIGVGRQAEVNTYGQTVFTGVKISLYDVSGDAPVGIDTYFVPGSYSYTPVQYDHKAFVSYEPEDADFVYMAIPVFEYDSEYYKSIQSVYVFKVGYEGSLDYLAKLTHQTDDHTYAYWYDSIERSVMIGNMIYTVSYQQIQQYQMDDDFSFVSRLAFDYE